ncbi:AraC family transcriptional regulator [Achromobacter sp. SIMBA_011]|uniref:helix-turn-helix domain-containing protein n=1 Tax=Achromobacter TaxID=222 RepID=UPI00142E9E9D|nr:AraC family transcriptional regulator [Achromobacter dolens]MCZ8406342.1 AraC family transcriptional regulator [Achromobacter dolens]
MPALLAATATLTKQIIHELKNMKEIDPSTGEPASIATRQPVKNLLDNIPSSWGQKLELGHQAVSVTCTGPNQIQYKADSHCILVLFTAQPNRELALNSDQRICGLAPIGSLEIVPAHSDVSARWTAPKENLLAALTEDRLRRLAGIEHGREDFELRPPALGTIDPRALHIAQRIRAELQSGEIASVESIDSWVTLLGVHVLRTHSSLNRMEARPPAGGLSPRAWKRVNEYIVEHIADKLTLENLAKVAQLSPSHFARAFRETVGQAPHQYILNMRLNVARQLILDTDTPLHEVSRRAGFSNNSHMTALIRRTWGLTPTRMRRN